MVKRIVLANMKPWSVLEDSTGRLWVSTDGGLFVSAKPLADYENGQRLQFLSRVGATALFNQTFTFGQQMALDTAGQIWVATKSDGLPRYRWQNDSALTADTLRTAETNQRENLRVFSVAVRKNGTICAAMKEEIVVYNLNATALDTLTVRNGLPSANTGVLYEGRSGVLFGACADGTIWQLDEENQPPVIKIIHAGLKHPVATLYETRDGNLWIATLGSGLVELNRQQSYRATVYGSKNGFLGEIFWDVLEDREGNLWLAQNTGLSKLPFNFRAVQFYSARSYPGQKPNLPASGVMAVRRTTTSPQESILWAGTENGLVAINSSGEIETLNTESGLMSNIIFSVCEDQPRRG